MPTVHIPLNRLRELYITDHLTFAHSYADKLVLRGFRFKDVPINKTRSRKEADPPLDIVRTDRELVVSQVVPGRVRDNDAALQGYLSQIKAGQKPAIDQLYGYLLAEGDDRASVIPSLEVVMPGGAGRYSVSEDWGTQTESPTSGREVDPQLVADRGLCAKVLVLFGVVQGDPL